MRSTTRAARFGFIALALAVGAAQSATAGAILYSVQSDGDGHLYQIDAGTGSATDLGAVTDPNIEGLASVGSTLYGLTGAFQWDLWDITTPPGNLIGSTGVTSGLDVGMAYDATSGTMYGEYDGDLYTINLGNGNATFVGSGGAFLDGMGIDAAGNAFAADFVTTNSLYSVNLANGAANLIGAFGVAGFANNGLAFGSDGLLYMMLDTGSLYTVNTGNGAATFATNIFDASGAQIFGFEGLAGQQAVPEPTSLLLLGFGLAALGLAKKRARRS